MLAQTTQGGAPFNPVLTHMVLRNSGKKATLIDGEVNITNAQDPKDTTSATSSTNEQANLADTKPESIDTTSNDSDITVMTAPSPQTLPNTPAGSLLSGTTATSTATGAAKTSWLSRFLATRKKRVPPKDAQKAELEETVRTLNEFIEEIGEDAMKDLKKSNAEIVNLYHTNEVLEGFVAEIRVVADEATSKVKLYENANTELEQTVQQLKDENWALEEKIDAACRQLEEQENAYETDGKKTGQQMAQLHLRIEQLELVEEERDDLRKENKELQLLHEMIGTLRAENKRLRTVEAQLEKMRHDLEAKDAVIESQARWVSTTQVNIDWQKEKLRKELDSESKAQRAETAKAQAAEFSKLNKTLEKQETELLEKAITIKQKTKTEEDMAVQVTELATDVAGLKQTVHDKEAELAIETEKREKLIQEMRDKDEAFKGNATKLAKAHGQLVNELAVKEARISDLEAGLAEESSKLKKVENDLETALEEQIASGVEFEALNAEKVTLTEELANAKNSDDSLVEQLQEQVDKLITELQSKTEERDRDCTELNDHIDELHAEREQHLAELAELKDKSNHPLTAASREAKKKIAAREKKINEVEAENAKLRKELQELRYMSRPSSTSSQSSVSQES
ncbi:hypothetical protein BU16DRAFT_614794 [Lophium mytilinum]|uniref:Uncharacterized protein n=1 Tax=Lophium mytilinum TaxID=390894 RepID=A0A6A6R6K2_9PEZI|nr:hypothetical protein BU16DRAFT_614794 [Lophium mytilinum]